MLLPCLLPPDRFTCNNSARNLPDQRTSPAQVLSKVEDGEVSVANMTADERTWVVAFSRDNGPSSYYVYSRYACGS